VTVSPMREFITLEGAGADKTIVQWGDTADTPAGPSGRPLGTFSSSTFAVNAQYFLARNITFKVTATTPLQFNSARAGLFFLPYATR
jgi:pectinesterase